MKILRYALLGLTCLLFTASSRPPTTPKDNFAATVSRLRDEVLDITSEWETLIYKKRKLLVEMNILIGDMDKVIQKIDSHEITYWNDEIEDINRRIGDFHDKSVHNKEDNNHKVKSLNHRHVAVECELDAKPRLIRLVYVGGLRESIDEWNSLVALDGEYNQQVDIYNDRVGDFNSKASKLPER